MTYTVSAVKSTRGREGYGFNCNLLLNGKKVAFCYDDASGGPLAIEWADHAQRATVTARIYDGTLRTYTGTPAEAAFHAFVNDLPQYACKFESGAMRFMSIELHIENLVNDGIALKAVQSDLKKSLTILDNGTLRNFKVQGAWTLEALRVAVVKKHPAATIVNDMPIADIIKLYREKNIIA